MKNIILLLVLSMVSIVAFGQTTQTCIATIDYQHANCFNPTTNEVQLDLYNDSNVLLDELNVTYPVTGTPTSTNGMILWDGVLNAGSWTDIELELECGKYVLVAKAFDNCQGYSVPVQGVENSTAINVPCPEPEYYLDTVYQETAYEILTDGTIISTTTYTAEVADQDGNIINTQEWTDIDSTLIQDESVLIDVQDNTGSDIPSTLVSPTIVGSPEDGNMIMQVYDDGYVMSIYNAGVWTNLPIPLSSSSTIYEVADQFARDALTPESGDVAIMTSVNQCDDKGVSWYNGTSWTTELVLIQSENHANILYGDPNGNDLKAQKGDSHWPYLDINTMFGLVDDYDVIELHRGVYEINTQPTISGDVFLDAPQATITNVPHNNIGFADGSRLTMDIDKLVLDSTDQPNYFFERNSSVNNYEVDIKANYVKSVSSSVSSWERTTPFWFHGTDLQADFGEVDFFGMDFIYFETSSPMVADVEIGDFTIVDRPIVNTNHVEMVFAYQPGVSLKTNLRIGNFYNETTHLNKSGVHIVNACTDCNTNVYVQNYESNSNRPIDVPDNVRYAIFGFANCVRGTQFNSNHYLKIDNILGEAAFRMQDTYNNSVINTHYVNANVDYALFQIDDGGQGAGLRLLNKSKVILQMDNVTSTDIVGRVYNTVQDDSYTYIGGEKWTTPKEAIVFSNVTLQNEQELVIDVGNVVSDNIVYRFTNLTVDATSKITFIGTAESTGAFPVIDFSASTINGTIVLENMTLINDGSVPVISSDTPVSIVVKDSYSNSLVIDPDVTEVASPITRDINIQ